MIILENITVYLKVFFIMNFLLYIFNVIYIQVFNKTFEMLFHYISRSFDIILINSS